VITTFCSLNSKTNALKTKAIRRLISLIALIYAINFLIAC